MPQHATDSGRVNIRVAGVCIVDGHLLLQSEEQIDFWVLPGGRPLLLESYRDALCREMKEEIDAEVEVCRLLWAVENFFAFEGEPFHELGYYYEMTLPPYHAPSTVGSAFVGREGERPLLFRWFALAELAAVQILPAFLIAALPALPPSTTHIIHRDPSLDPRAAGRRSP